MIDMLKWIAKWMFPSQAIKEATQFAKYESMDLRTDKCIVTGRPATVWSGHVLVQGFGKQNENDSLELVLVAVHAGFADSQIFNSVRHSGPCYGKWQPSFGVRLFEPTNS